MSLRERMFDQPARLLHRRADGRAGHQPGRDGPASTRISIAAGVLLGRKAYKDDEAARRPAPARARRRPPSARYIDEVVFQVSKHLKDRLRPVNRTLRDLIGDRVREMSRTLGEAHAGRPAGRAPGGTAERDARIRGSTPSCSGTSVVTALAGSRPRRRAPAAAPGSARRRRGIEDDVRALLDDALECLRGRARPRAARLRAQRAPARRAAARRAGGPGEGGQVHAAQRPGRRAARADGRRRVHPGRHRVPARSLPRVALHGVDGASRVLPVRRDRRGAAPRPRRDRAGARSTGWSSTGRRRRWTGCTLVDTPGTRLADRRTPGAHHGLRRRTTAGPGPDGAGLPDPAGAARGPGRPHRLPRRERRARCTRRTLVVLSRADEVGSGQLEAMLAARDAARSGRRRSRRSGRWARPVVPVAGLLGLAGRRCGTATSSRCAASRPAPRARRRGHAAHGRPVPPAPRCRVPLSAAMRTALLEELGLFGVRLAVALLRGGARHPRRARRRARAPQRAARSSSGSSTSTSGGAATRAGGRRRSAAVEQVLRSSPCPGTAACGPAPRAGAAGLARPDGARPADPAARRRRAAAARPAGPRPRGCWARRAPAAAERLGLPADAARGRASGGGRLAAVTRWRDRAADPLAGRATVDACEVLARSAEEILARLDRRLAVSAGPVRSRPARSGAQPGA